MSWNEPDSFDGRCPHCGRGYYFEVGMGRANCDGCGKPFKEPENFPEVSDEDYANSALDFALDMDNPLEALELDEFCSKEAVIKIIRNRIVKLQLLLKQLGDV